MSAWSIVALSVTSTLLFLPTAADSPRTVRIGLLDDQTGSSIPMRTPHLTVDSIVRLVDAVKGQDSLTLEVGVGLIRDVSRQGLIRLRIDPPPTPPAAAAASSGNAFIDLKTRQQSGRERDAYLLARQAWVSKTQTDVEAFKRRLAPVLTGRDDAQSTDVFTPIRRVLAFLNEPTADGSSARKFILLASDAQDNSAAQFSGIPTSVKLILTNGFGSAGSLERYNPSLFENLEAAVEFLISEIRK